MSDNHSGGRSMDGRPAEPLPEGWARPAASRGGQQARAGGIQTFSSLSREPTPPPNQSDREGAEFYTGGERSGLAVQNPNDPAARGDNNPRSVVENILQQAMRSGTRTPSSRPQTPRDPWSGQGHTLGSDEQPSTTVGDAPAAQADDGEGQVQQRTLTFWRDGFSIEDGELYKYDAPGNRELLAAIQGGRAPVSLFNVAYDQPLELVVQQRTNEDYRPSPKAPARPFGGEGNRLGSVVPSIVGAGAARSGHSTPPTTTAASSGSTAAGPTIAIDSSKPTTNVQVRLGDGSRVVARVNLTSTVGEIRAFVTASRPNETCPFVLQTTFPSRELKDDETVEGAKLANAVVVQRFV